MRKKHQKVRPAVRPGAAATSSQANLVRAKTRLRPPRLMTYVDAVARHGSIRKAADALNVASSALNRQIIELETDLGTPLFERLPRGVRITSAGEAYLVYARMVMSELMLVESRIAQLRGLVRGQVNVAAAESVAGDFLPAAITRFQTTHPYVRFHVQVGAPESLAEALIQDHVDLILTHEMPRKKDVAIIAIARQALCAIVPRNHPLAKRKELRLRDCLSYPLALGDTTLAGRGLIEQVLARSTFDLDPRLVSNSVEAMKAFARMNHGVCFQFRAAGKALNEPGDMAALPLTDPALLQARLLLATRRSRVLPVAAAAFVEQAKLDMQSA